MVFKRGKDLSGPRDDRCVDHLVIQSKRSFIASDLGDNSPSPFHVLSIRLEGAMHRLQLPRMYAEHTGKPHLPGMAGGLFNCFGIVDVRVHTFPWRLQASRTGVRNGSDRGPSPRPRSAA